MSTNKNINISIITTLTCPSGEAAMNRILSYSKGLTGIGDKVTIYTTGVGENMRYGEINGVRFKNLRTKTKKTYLKIFYLLIALISLIKHLTIKDNNYQAVVIVSNSLFLIYPLFLICKLINVKLILEKSEFPFVLNSKSFFGKLFSKYYTSSTYKLFDGMIIMTNALNNYFKKLTTQRCKRIVLPMTVVPERFEFKKKNLLGDYVAYCGDIGGNKDGVKNLIKSFSLIESRYPSLKLILIGGSKDPKEREFLENYAKELRAQNIVFYGRVNRDEIPVLLNNALILTLARPSSLQSSGGFPTKLGEYLSTGKPTIVTKVGEIPMYLTDGKNAYLVEPNDEEKFAKKIMYVLDNYNEALEVASEGKKLTQTIFNYKFQAKRLHDFFIHLIYNNK